MDVVEIHPGVVAAAHQFFKLPDDPERLAITVADGAEFVAACPARYDLILVDGFGPDARPGRLDRTDFYAACRTLLTPPGLLASNLLGRSRGFAASATRIREAFDGRSVVFPSCDSGNAICFAATGEPVDCSVDELRERARRIKADTGLDLQPTIARLQLARALPGDRFRL